MPVYQMALYEDVRIDVPHRRVQLFLIDVRIFDKEEKLKKKSEAREFVGSERSCASIGSHRARLLSEFCVSQ